MHDERKSRRGMLPNRYKEKNKIERLMRFNLRLEPLHRRNPIQLVDEKVRDDCEI